MSNGQPDGVTLVRQFRQILIWPLQLVPIRADAQIQKHWELLERDTADNPWGELRDEFGCDPADSRRGTTASSSPSCRTCGAFSTATRAASTAAASDESPIRVFRRNDVAKVRPEVSGTIPFR
jgi:hypothetical protein